MIALVLFLKKSLASVLKPGSKCLSIGSATKGKTHIPIRLSTKFVGSTGRISPSFIAFLTRNKIGFPGNPPSSNTSKNHDATSFGDLSN